MFVCAETEGENRPGARAEEEGKKLERERKEREEEERLGAEPG